jgi:leucyl aminopeptidase
MITLTAGSEKLNRARADVVALLVFEDRKIFLRQKRMLKTVLGDAAAPLETGAFTGESGETFLLYPRNAKTRFLLLVGAGKAGELTLESLRRASARAAKSALKLRASTLAMAEPDTEALALSPSGSEKDLWEQVGCALAEGTALSLYRFDRYLTTAPPENKRLRRFLILSESPSRLRRLRQGLGVARAVCGGTLLARDLANAPGNEIYPETLARTARSVARRTRARTTVLREEKIRALKMGGLLGVSQGSKKGPRFIIMEMNRNARHGTVVLVGKGVTFDSGGISIKPSAGMGEMKMDMSGAAAVIGAMEAAARLRLPVHLVGLIPATENLPSGAALKPGDILTHANGKTSEVDNTDAEGRLILADALAYATRYKPDLVIDLATLTGACVVALGHVSSGMMGNDQEMMNRLKRAGERVYERVWQLPLHEEYARLIKSNVADVKNVGGRWGGAITAAMFLKTFIGDYRWIHLDIAGTAIVEEPSDYIPKGGSGVGVRLLIDFLRHWKKT